VIHVIRYVDYGVKT